MLKWGLLTLLLLGGAGTGNAADLSELALFHRCYAHLTGKSLPFTDAGNVLAPLGSPLRSQVKAGTKTARVACNELLNASLLGAGGRLNSQNVDSLAVLRNFNDYHRTWFEIDDMTRVLPEGNRATRFYVDESEPGLHVTRALLSSGVNFSEIVTQANAMEALRTSGAITAPTTTTTVYGENLIRTAEPFYSTYLLRYPIVGANKPGDSLGNLAPAPVGMMLTGEIVQLGELLGVRPMNLNSTKLAMGIYETNPYGGVGTREYSNPNLLRTNVSLGGGVIGTKSYLIMNLGRTTNNTPDGGQIVHRRWAKTVFKDLLCRELPVLRTADSSSFVQTNGPGFRRSNSCMLCHATMDRLANSIRNVSYSFTPGGSDTSASHIAVWDTTITTDPTATGPVNADPNFYKTPPNGVLYFRDYKGNLVNISTSNGPAGLGQQLAQTEDLYVCAAARYFEYFTGIHVTLRDPAGVTLSPQEKSYLDQVTAWGVELKSTQNLRTLIDRIISSPIYRRDSLQ